MEEQSQGRYSAQQFRDLVKDIPFAMFTTITAVGALRSRPMVATENAFDGTLWFFTRTSSAVAQEIAGLLGETTAQTKVHLLKLAEMLKKETL